jgi:hypothetical protein
MLKTQKLWLVKFFKSNKIKKVKESVIWTMNLSKCKMLNKFKMTLSFKPINSRWIKKKLLIEINLDFIKILFVK